MAKNANDANNAAMALTRFAHAFGIIGVLISKHLKIFELQVLSIPKPGHNKCKLPLHFPAIPHWPCQQAKNVSCDTQLIAVQFLINRKNIKKRGYLRTVYVLSAGVNFIESN